MRHIATVITYQHAYVLGETSLCQHHAEQPPAWVPALGPVSHGEHEGACEACGDCCPACGHPGCCPAFREPPSPCPAEARACEAEHVHGCAAARQEDVTYARH